MERVAVGEPGPQRQSDRAAPPAGAEGPALPDGAEARTEAASDRKRFLIGTAISVYQNSGDPASQWDHFQDRRVLCGLMPAIMNGDRVGKSTNFWDRRGSVPHLGATLGRRAWRALLAQSHNAAERAVSRAQAPARSKSACAAPPWVQRVLLAKVSSPQQTRTRVTHGCRVTWAALKLTLLAPV